MDDQALMARVVSGQPEAIGELYDRYGPHVYALARRMTGDRAAAEDLTQEVFVKVWLHAERYEAGRGRVATWILHIAYTTAVDYLRKSRRTPGPVADPPEPPDTTPGGDPSEQAELALLGEDVRRALLHLPPEQRQALELAYFNAMTQSEIGRQLGIPLGTVKSRVRRGLAAMRQLLMASPRKEVEGRVRLSSQ